MHIVTNTMIYLDGEVPLEGFFAYDADLPGQRPLVLIHHAWAGRDGFVAEKAQQLAELGYLGFAADTYGKGILGRSPEENAGLMRPFMEDRAKLRQRLLAALTAAKQLPWADQRKIAAIGFCFGCLCALDLARSGAKIGGVAAFHGLLNPPPPTLEKHPINAKVLVLHGHDDPMVSTEQILALQTELTEAGSDWQFISYGRTLHAFTNPVANNPAFGTVYQPQTARRSWLALQQFLTEIFQGDA